MFPYIARAKRGIAKAMLRNGNVERQSHGPAIEASDGFHPDFPQAFGHNTIARCRVPIIVYVFEHLIFQRVARMGYDGLSTSRIYGGSGPGTATVNISMSRGQWR